MRIEYLEEFLTLASTLNFSAAARARGISQPVLSAHIKSLEAELEVRLFDRDKHSVFLTDVGERLIDDTTQIVSHYNHLIALTRDSIDMLSSSLVVGYLYNGFRAVMPSVSSEFANEHPGVAFSMRSFGFLGVSDALKNDEVDIALTIDVDEKLHENCNVVELGDDVLCCVVRSDDPLAKYESISLASLHDEPFILPSPDDSGAYASYLMKMFDKAGYRPRVSVFYHEIDTRYLSVCAGEGISLIGAHFRPYMNADVKFIPLSDEGSRYSLVALWKKTNRNKNIPKFISLIEERMRERD